MSQGHSRRLYENNKLPVYEKFFFERGNNLITLILAELGEKSGLQLLEKIGCKIKKGRIKEVDKIVMSLDYVCVGSSSHAIEQNIKTGESRYIEKRIIRKEKGRLINWEQKDSSKVSSKNAKKFNQNISSKVYYLLEYMKQYIPEETFTKLDYLFNEIYSES